jgi:hypothetical protein
MPPLETRLRTRATANICALYPVWQQSKLNRRGTPEELAALAAWEDANVEHMKLLLRQADASYEIDPDADWPDPEAWEAPEYTATEAAEPVALHPDLLPEMLDEETQAETNSRLNRELIELYGKQAWAASSIQGRDMSPEDLARLEFLQPRVWSGQNA